MNCRVNFEPSKSPAEAQPVTKPANPCRLWHRTLFLDKLFRVHIRGQSVHYVCTLTLRAASEQLGVPGRHCFLKLVVLHTLCPRIHTNGPPRYWADAEYAKDQPHQTGRRLQSFIDYRFQACGLQGLTLENLGDLAKKLKYNIK